MVRGRYLKDRGWIWGYDKFKYDFGVGWFMLMDEEFLK